MIVPHVSCDSATTSARDDTPFVHPMALCESDAVGPGTRIWPFAQVMAGAVIGEDCQICGHAFIESGAVLGDRVTVKNGALIWDGVTIGDDVFVGPGMIFTNAVYPRSRRGPQDAQRWLDAGDAGRRAGPIRPIPTIVQKGASIGAGAVIVCGITVGAHATIAAGAVVTRDVAPHALVVGHPARPRGWMCQCARKLDDRLRCGVCGRSYTVASEDGKDTLSPCFPSRDHDGADSEV